MAISSSSSSTAAAAAAQQQLHGGHHIPVGHMEAPLPHSICVQQYMLRVEVCSEYASHEAPSPQYMMEAVYHVGHASYLVSDSEIACKLSCV
jgi:hypothetical protein